MIQAILRMLTMVISVRRGSASCEIGQSGSPIRPLFRLAPALRLYRAKSGKGHKGRFRPLGLSASYGFSEETFAVGRGKEEEAQIPDRGGIKRGRQ
jgi:hypothetical protein